MATAQKVRTANDIDGRELSRGDMVATVNGNITAKITDIACEFDDTLFVCLRPIHQPFGKGVWHAADQVQRIAVGKKVS